MLSEKFKKEGRQNNITSVSDGYRESGNIRIEKSKDIQNSITELNENSEFKNKRVPLDGIELLLNREKIPDDLGKKMDKKNIQEKPYNQIHKNDTNMLSDLDDIISDAESIHDKSDRNEVNQLSENSFSNSRKKERLGRRVINRKKDRIEPNKSFFPSSKINRSENQNFESIPNEPNDDVLHPE